MNVRAAAAAALLLVPLLAGCSQVAAIAPVGGNHLAEVRYAAIDVLVASGVDVLAAPVCTQSSAGEVSCAGETADGSAISVVSTSDDPDEVTVSVGDRELYSGSIMSVIDEAARNG